MSPRLGQELITDRSDGLQLNLAGLDDLSGLGLLQLALQTSCLL